jgi:dTDP-4-dehydrorhamnose 3,5-epimerase
MNRLPLVSPPQQIPKIQKTPLEGVLVIEPLTVFEDFRGHYVELYNAPAYRAAGIDYEFVQDDISVSRRHVLRGIHGDQKTAKLVSCLQGAFYLVVLNYRHDSAQHKKWTAFTLSESNRQQVLVPPGFGLGMLGLTETTIFHYKQTSTYDGASQFTVRWNDPEMNIWWPVRDPITSQRDSGLLA